MIECNMYVLMLCLGIPDIDNELFKTQYFISENMFCLWWSKSRIDCIIIIPLKYIVKSVL